MIHKMRFLKFLKKRKRIKNMRKQTLNLRKPINKMRFFKFLKIAEMDQKYEEMSNLGNRSTN